MMKRQILQIPIKPELREKAEKKAESLGFSSLQEMVRVILTQMTTGMYSTVSDICEKYGIEYVGMFGSTARGDERPDSDVDLFVRFGVRENIGLYELDQIQKDFEIRFGRKVDLVTRLNRHILPEALKDMKTIYEK